jgi:putative N6-adenine-specific DNA methylase
VRVLPQPRIFASDTDLEACRALEECLPRHGLEDAVRVQAADFFRLDPGDLSLSRPGLVVLNPPYGRRLGTPAESRDLMGAVLARLCDRYSGWRFVLVAPASVRPAGMPAGTAVHPVFHGGLNVRFFIGQIP